MIANETAMKGARGRADSQVASSTVTRQEPAADDGRAQVSTGDRPRGRGGYWSHVGRPAQQTADKALIESYARGTAATYGLESLTVYVEGHGWPWIRLALLLGVRSLTAAWNRVNDANLDAHVNKLLGDGKPNVTRCLQSAGTGARTESALAMIQLEKECAKVRGGDGAGEFWCLCWLNLFKDPSAAAGMLKSCKARVSQEVSPAGQHAAMSEVPEGNKRKHDETRDEVVDTKDVSSDGTDERDISISELVHWAGADSDDDEPGLYAFLSGGPNSR